MTKRIFHSICLVALIVFFSSVILIMGVLYSYFSDVQQSQLKMQTELAAQGVSKSGLDYFDNLDAADFRITWIDQNGKVLYDSESDMEQMENHLQREEIQEACEKGYGESRRYSVTLMERRLYAAKRLGDGTILRLSVAQTAILTLLLGMIQPVCIVFLTAVILSVVLAVRLTRNIVKPLNGLNLDKPLSNREYDELSPLLKRIDSQQRQLKYQESILSEKKRELDTIINNMKEGMLLLNWKGEIISINPAAAKLLNTDSGCVGTDIRNLHSSPYFHEIIEKALDGERAQRMIELPEGNYQLDANPVVSGTLVSGAAVWLLDVTEKEKAEQMRREFTANVSHELKTPLHAISGYAELLNHNMVDSKDVGHFAGEIYSEAQRMVQLVEDIISLSHLDEGAEDLQKEETDLYALAHEVLHSLQPQALRQGVTLELEGAPAVVNGIPQLLHGILYNLVDNAVKYNHADGTAVVTISENEKFVTLSVRDTGIGIDTEHQERIFERFYRVDKSRSREVGGTGLGLSIVKHAAKIHHAQIKLQSVPGEGTVISVSFEK